MGIHSKIQYCDSTANLQMGCAGCELWNPATGVRRCYAGVQTEMRTAGGTIARKGWPERFELPTIFPARMAEVERWADLTGTDREDKPWMNGLPRTIFLNDMGDTFSEGMDPDWFAPYVPRLAALPHNNILLTKRPRRMREFWERQGSIPQNFWLCTTVTNKASLPRISELVQIEGASVLGLSIEPLWDDIERMLWDIPGIERIRWVKIGGESGTDPLPCDIRWIRSLVEFFLNLGAAVFVKQLGGNPYYAFRRLDLKDYHGGDWDEWPDDLRIREMPVQPLVGV